MTRADEAVVWHIGPHKTGTTTMQAALWANREAMRAQGVGYPGDRRHEMDAAMAVALGKVDPGKDLDAHRARWHELVAQMHRDDTRTDVLSSEFYCEASDERIADMLGHLGEDTRVVITLRPIVDLIGSQWQQYTQNRLTTPYDEWLRDVLDHPDGSEISPSFWRRHRHDLLVARWAHQVTPGRVTVIVPDARDHRSLPDAFERLLGLTAGTLDPPAERLNRSLTYDEVALMQAFNEAYRGEPWDNADYNRFIRFGAARGVQARERDPDHQPVLTPQWAVDRALEIGEMMAGSIAESGVEVIGSLEWLADPAAAPRIGENEPVDSIAPEVLAGFAAGMVGRLNSVPSSPAPRPAAGPVERALWTQHRNQNPAKVRADADRLQAKADTLRSELEPRRDVAHTGRVGVLREILRRVRRRLTGSE